MFLESIKSLVSVCDVRMSTMMRGPSRDVRALRQHRMSLGQTPSNTKAPFVCLLIGQHAKSTLTFSRLRSCIAGVNTRGRGNEKNCVIAVGCA